MLTCEQARIANNEQVENCKHLQWQQDPMITPLAHRFGETEIQQKSVIQHIVDHMTRREAMNGDEVMDADAVLQTWAGTANKDSQASKEGGRREYRLAIHS
jgi:hypothetical protein